MTLTASLQHTWAIYTKLNGGNKAYRKMRGTWLCLCSGLKSVNTNDHQNHKLIITTQKLLSCSGLQRTVSINNKTTGRYTVRNCGFKNKLSQTRNHTVCKLLHMVPGVYSSTWTVWGSARSSDGLILCLRVSEVVLGTIIGTGQNKTQWTH